jgi:YD repeat-containing protein
MKLPPLEPPFRAPPGTLDAFAGSLAVAGDTILRVVERAAESACSGTAIRRGMLLASLETWEWRYEYDEKGRRKSAARVDRATGRVLEITHYYYSLDRLSWEETSAGGKVIRQVHYEYERDGRLRSWTLHEVDYDGDIPVRVREYEFDAQDRLLRERVIEIPRER